MELISVVRDLNHPAAQRLLDSMTSFNREQMHVEVLAGPNRHADALDRVTLGSSSAYLIVDERTVFLRPFGLDDFLTDSVPRAFLTEDREFWVGASPAEAAAAALTANTARTDLSVVDPRRLGNRGPVLLSSDRMRAMQETFLDPRGLTWTDLLDRAPDLSAWYAAWLQATGFVGVVPVEPIFRSMTTADECMSVVVQRMTVSDVARGYLGVVCTDPVPWTMPADEPDLLARVASAPTLVRALALRPYLRLPRVRRIVDRARG